ncbi:MAG: hypothetical protein ACE5NA_01565 [Nitrospiraceae bacterium]
MRTRRRAEKVTAAVADLWSHRLAFALRGSGQEAFASYLVKQRWFSAKGRRLTGVRLLDYVLLPEQPHPTFLALVGVEFDQAPSEIYTVPMFVQPQKRSTRASTAKASAPMLVLEGAGLTATVHDGMDAPLACAALLDGIRNQTQWKSKAGTVTCAHTAAGAPHLPVTGRQIQRSKAEQSNTSIIYDRRLILKLIRKLGSGVNPDFEVIEFLTTRTAFRHIPLLVGHIQYEGSLAFFGSSTFSSTIGVLQQFVPNEGDGWSYTLQYLDALLARARATQDLPTEFIHQMRRLGEITGGLHVALASDASRPGFSPEPVTLETISDWRHDTERLIHTVMSELRATSYPILSSLGLGADDIERLEARSLESLADLTLLLKRPVDRIRIHGDYHLGQVLKTETDFVILDFEGEPARLLAERRKKACPLKDVAGMLRSFNYAAHVALQNERSGLQRSQAVAKAWEAAVTRSFLEGYFAEARPGEVRFLPASREDAMRVARVFQLEKAIYELHYELQNRPDWIAIPLHGLRELLSTGVN